MKKVNELSPGLKKRYSDKAKDSKDSHQRIATDYKTRTGKDGSFKSDWTDHMGKVHQRKADNRAKGIKRAEENVSSADKKPEMYTDPQGTRKVRMVKVDREVLKKEGYVGGKGEKGRDYHNAGTFDKETAYRHAKTHNGVVHKDPSGSYLVKHGRGKNVSEGYRDPFKSAQRSAKYKELSHEYEKEKSYVPLSKLRKMRQKPVKKEESGENNNPQKKDISVSDYKKKTGKKTVSLKHLTKNTHIDPFKEETIAENKNYDKTKKSHKFARSAVRGMSNIMRAEYHKDGTATIHTNSHGSISSVNAVDHHHKDIGAKHNRPASDYKNSTVKIGGLTHKTKEISKHRHEIHISEETIAELSKDTLSSYKKKATQSAIKHHVDSQSKDPNPDSASTANKRVRGLARLKKVKTEKNDPCWDDYEMVGMKKKNGKSVPNCVPKESVVSELTDKEREEIARTRARKAPARDADGRSSVKRQQKKKDAAANPKKAAAPKPVKSKPKTTYDDKADLHPIVQLRKVVDTKGIHKPVFHKGKTGKVSADDAHHALKLYDKLPVMGKRQLKIRLAKGGPAAVKQAAKAHRSLGK